MKGGRGGGCFKKVNIFWNGIKKMHEYSSKFPKIYFTDIHVTESGITLMFIF